VGREEGQATIEWTGLVLLAAVVLGALAAVRPNVDGQALGGSVAQAITCAARGGCDLPDAPARRESRRLAANAPPEGAGLSAPPPPGARRPRASPRAPAPRETARSPSPNAPSTRRGARRPTPAPVSAGRAAAAFHVLRGVRNVAQKAWIICIGYRRFVYERSHPRLPTEAMPLDEALDIANECLNPLGFFADE
jgi:hypothetical protein